MTREAWVLGAASNRFGKMKETGREAASRVALEAIQIAGIEPKDIGYTFVANAFGVAEKQAHVGPLINTALGIPEVPSCTIESACSSSSAALHEAYVHVAGGFRDAALVVGVEKLSHLDTLNATSYFAMGADYPFESHNGATFPGLYATIANAHMRRYGTQAEQLGGVAVKNHANAALNPHAHFQKPISMDTYLNSAVIASPLRLYDCCPFSDGAAALVVVAAEKYPNPRTVPLVIRASTRAGSIADMHDRRSSPDSRQASSPRRLRSSRRMSTGARSISWRSTTVSPSRSSSPSKTWGSSPGVKPERPRPRGSRRAMGNYRSILREGSKPRATR